MASISSFSGLASGVQWTDLVDQLVAVDKSRKLDPITAQQTLAQKRIDAWTSYQSLVSKFRDATKALRDGSALSQFKVSGGASGTTGRTLLTASASAGAVPGTYNVEVVDVARANKLSGNVVASASTALGLAPGDFLVNGQKVSVVATDTLAMVRDKINALNAGATPTGVTASVLSTGTSQHRLVLTSDQAGAGGIELVDGSAATLQSLGVVDATRTLNLSSDGGVQSNRLSSTSVAVTTMLGGTYVPPSSIVVGGRVINVDLATDSLSSIASKIIAAGGNATIATETQGTKTSYRLVTSDTVTASTPDGQRTLDVLGFTKAGRSGIAQIVKSENTYSDGTGAIAGAATLLSDLQVNGNPLGLVAGDTFSIQGQRGDGTAVSVSYTVGAGDTMQTLLNRINDPTTGFAAGSRTAAASLVNGQIVLTDSTTGDSQLSVSVSATRAADGSVVSLGRQLTSTIGRNREVVSGSDAKLRVDGVFVQRPSNTITDALAGVTLSLQQAEVGSTVSVVVDRDVDAITSKVKDVATAYSELVKFRTAQSADGAPLKGNPTLRASLASFTGLLLTNLPGATGTFNRAGAAGLALQTDGSLKLDETVFKAALASNFSEVSALFSTTGTSNNSQLTYFSSGGKTVPGTYAVNITAAATTPSVLGSGFSGTYADDATADVLTITDAVSGATGNIDLVNGDTTDTIVTKLNTLFANSKMALTASKSGNELVITGARYGSGSTFTVAYTGGGANGTAQLGLGAATYAGTDVAGTIGGETAIGSGQVLTAKPVLVGQPVDGLSVTYTGTATGAVGDLTFSLGVSGTLFNAADIISAPTGTISLQQESLNKTVSALKLRADTIQQMLDRKRAALVKQFSEMEVAINKINTQASSITNYLNSLQQSK